MSWTYSTTLATGKDQIRLLIGDTDTTDQQLQDEEIAFILSDEGNLYRAAASCAMTIAGKYARRVDYAMNRGEVQETLSQLQTQYTQLAKDLRRRASRDIAAYVGGQSISEKAIDSTNSDLVQPIFTKSGMTEPGTETGDRDDILDSVPQVTY